MTVEMPLVLCIHRRGGGGGGGSCDGGGGVQLGWRGGGITLYIILIIKEFSNFLGQ